MPGLPWLRNIIHQASGRDEDAFFREIIATCQSQLLVRLRSSHAKSFRKAGRPAIISRLSEGIKLLNKLRNRPSALASVQDQIVILEAEFKSLESLSFSEAHSEPGRRCLEVILGSIERVLACTDVRTLLDLIPKDIPAWSGPAAESLTRSLTCLAQYQYAARYLLRRACKDPIFRHLSMAEIRSESCPKSPRGSEPLAVTAGLLSRSLKEEFSTRRKGVLEQLEAKTGKSRAQIESFIHSHALASKRVHAEIKLLLYYEVHHASFRLPRIICSNKHACVLCNLFIKVHGKFYIRGCHGRLYPKWRIPILKDVMTSEASIARMQQALDEVNNLLEIKIREFLDRPRLKIADPCESIVFIPQAFTASTISTVSSLIPGSDGSDLRGGLASTLVQSISPHSVSKYTSSSSSRPVALQHLARGGTIRTRVNSGSSIRIHTRRIHLEMTYESVCAMVSSVSTSEAPSKDTSLVIQVQWIHEASIGLYQHANRIVDLSLPCQSKELPDGILLSDLGLVLKQKDDIVNLRVLRR